MFDVVFVKDIIKALPNMIGLIVLAYVLWLINADTSARLDVQFQLLVNCLAQGPH